MLEHGPNRRIFYVMTQYINSLAQIAQKYDAIIFDQWAVQSNYDQRRSFMA